MNDRDQTMVNYYGVYHLLHDGDDGVVPSVNWDEK